MSNVVKQFPIEKEYEKNPDVVAEDIQKLRQWLDTQPHLPRQHLTDLDLFLVFHCCEKSFEVSKQVLDLHYTLRTLFTVFFKDRVYDNKVDFSLNTILFAPLADQSLFGYRVVYVRLLDTDPKNFFFNDIIRTFMMMFDLWQYEEGSWPGLSIVIDMDQTVVGHITRLEVMAIKKVLYFLQECMLVKLKEVHFRNAPHFMDKLMMLLKPFLNKTLLDIIYIHPVGTDSMDKYIQKTSFPKEDGGSYNDRATIQKETIARFKANPQFFKEENLKRVNEALRPGGSSKVQDLFGIQGSFKKLDLD